LTEANELYKIKILSRVKDFDLQYRLDQKDLEDIDRKMWEKYLRIYSLLGVWKV